MNNKLFVFIGAGLVALFSIYFGYSFFQSSETDYVHDYAISEDVAPLAKKTGTDTNSTFQSIGNNLGPTNN